MKQGYINTAEIKPALATYIEKSKSLLKQSVFPDAKAVHDVRVYMKKSRAVLKLIAPQLDSKSARREILAFREAGRKIQEWRDSSVHRKTLNELRKKFPEIFSRLDENEKICFLLKKRETRTGYSEEIKVATEQVINMLAKSGYRIRFLTMNMIDPQLLIKELDLTYKKSVHSYLACRNSSKPCKYHEFRKTSKDFLYQLFFFRPLNTSGVRIVEEKLDRLTQNLGKFNDLDQLIKKIGYRNADGSNLPALDELIIRIRDKQDRYLSKVWPSAYKIFCPGNNLAKILRLDDV